MNDEINVETKVKEALNLAFPGYRFSLIADPEDSSVVLIRLYDVEDCEVKEFRTKLWDLIDEYLTFDEISFIPSIVSHTNTVKYYAQFLRACESAGCLNPNSRLDVAELELLKEHVPETHQPRTWMSDDVHYEWDYSPLQGDELENGRNVGSNYKTAA